jgi:hypothetical protein
MKPALIFLVGILLAACAGKQAEQIAFPTVCKAEDDHKYYAITGYLTDDGSVFCSSTSGRLECGFTLTETQGGGAKLSSYIAQGSGSNSVEKFESGYKKSDIKIHDASGALINLGDKVKLTGDYNAVPDGSHCFLEVDKIEKQ